MKRTIVVVTLAVFALSLMAAAANHPNMISTSPKAGGHAYKGGIAPDTTVLNLLATKDPYGVYLNWEGYIITGTAMVGVEFDEAESFTITAPTAVKTFETSVNYIVQGTDTQFAWGLMADASGIPSGAFIGTGPWPVTINSQTFGQCCLLETGTIPKGGLGKKVTKLPAGTYWIVLVPENPSGDLYAEVNLEVLDEVNTTWGYAYNTCGSAAPCWYSYNPGAGWYWAGLLK